MGLFLDSKNKQIYRRLLVYSKPYAGRIALAMLASLIVAGVDVSYANLIEPLVDKIITAGNVGLVTMIPIVVIGLAIIKGLARFCQEFMIKTAGQLVVQDVRNDLFGHSMKLSMGYYSRHPSGALMSRILNDVGVLQRSAADVLVEALRESFTLVGLVCLAFYKDWRLASVAFLVLPLCVLPAMVIGRRIKKYTSNALQAMGFFTTTLQEAFAGIKVIKAFGRESAHGDVFRKENLNFYHFMRKVIKYDSATAPIIEILASLGSAAVLWYGVSRVLSGAMTQGELFSIVAAIFLMYTPVKRLTRVSNTIQRSLGAAEGVFETLDYPLDIQERTEPEIIGRARGSVKFENINFSYGDEPVLTDFSLDARPGEVVALVGPSGAGKTTVAGLLARFYDPQGGEVSIDGHDVRGLSFFSHKSNIAYVDQETFLFHTTIRENIRYGRPDATDLEVEEAARQAFASDFISELPQGYETSIGDRGVRLSGGQRQRLCIARALLSDAPILILDEATSALDTESESMVQLALSNLMNNRTTLVIAHRLSTIMNADRILVLEQGRVVESGTHQELLANGGLYRRLYDLQFRNPEDHETE